MVGFRNWIERFIAAPVDLCYIAITDIRVLKTFPIILRGGKVHYEITRVARQRDPVFVAENPLTPGFLLYFSKHTTLGGGGGGATGNGVHGRSTCRRPAFVSPVSTRPKRHPDPPAKLDDWTSATVRASASSFVLNELCAFDSSPGKVSVIVAVRRVPPAPEDTARGRNDHGRASCLKKYIFFLIIISPSLCRPVHNYSVRVRPVHINVYTKRTYLCIHTPADAGRP